MAVASGRVVDAASAGDGALTVLVSHRFSTVRMADLIVVVADGRILEAGAHADLIAAGADLIAAGGLYAELYGLQARAYRPSRQMGADT